MTVRSSSHDREDQGPLVVGNIGTGRLSGLRRIESCESRPYPTRNAFAKPESDVPQATSSPKSPQRGTNHRAVRVGQTLSLTTSVVRTRAASRPSRPAYLFY